MKFTGIAKLFEPRLALVPAALASAVVALLGTASYSYFERTTLENLDQALRSHAAVAFSTEIRPFPWQHIEAEIESGYPTGPVPNTTLFWARTDMVQFYRSKSWPVDLDPRLLMADLQIGDSWKKNRRSTRVEQLPEDDSQEPSAASGAESTSDGTQDDEPDEALIPIRTGTYTAGGHDWRMAAFLSGKDGLVLGRLADEPLAQLAHYRNALIASIPVTFLIVFAAGAWLLRRRITPLKDVTLLIEQITADHLTRRAKLENADAESKELVRAFNDMLDRLEMSFEDARRFSGLAAHELKTPLAILQGKLDLAIHEERPGSQRQQFLAELLEDVGRLKGVIEKLLLLSRADAGRLDLNIVDINLSDMLEQHVQDLELLAPELQIKASIPEGEHIQGDKTLINLLLQNLISNAMKHNKGGDEAFIKVELTPITNGVRLAVANSANPIPMELHQKIFSRFGRAARQQGSNAEGAGLGLSMAYEIARVHGGRLKLKESSREQTMFVLKLRRVALPPPNVSTNWRILKRVEPLSSNPV
jgi:signal transduction histidine kinase